MRNSEVATTKAPAAKSRRGKKPHDGWVCYRSGRTNGDAIGRVNGIAQYSFHGAYPLLKN